MNYLQKLLKINAKKFDFILILILSLLYKFDNNNLINGEPEANTKPQGSGEQNDKFSKIRNK